jgi:hypothetical protein
MSLTDAQINALLEPLSPGRVRKAQGMDHLEAWDDRRWLLRIFGWGGFDIEADETLVSERSIWDESNPAKGRHTVIYRVKTRLTIKDPKGNVIAHFEDGAVGDAQNQPSLGDAHDQALKTAHSQALKRCCVNLGDAFGLSLYSKTRMSDGSPIAVVGRSVAHPGSDEHQAEENVTSGEMDHPKTGEEVPAAPTAEVTSPTTPSAGLAEGEAPAALPSTSPDVAAPQDKQQIVAKIRAQALEAAQQSRRDALPALGRLNIDAGKARVLREMTTELNGAPITLGMLLSNLINNCTRGAA